MWLMRFVRAREAELAGYRIRKISPSLLRLLMMLFALLPRDLPPSEKSKGRLHYSIPVTQ